MHWTVAAPFTVDPARDLWLTPYVGGRHDFLLVPAGEKRSWHARRTRTAGLSDWRRSWSQGRAAWTQSRGGVITVFPNLALTVGLHQRYGLLAGGPRRPVVAWCFNLGRLYEGPRGALARTALSGVERVVVHSRAEVGPYAEWLQLPPRRVRFVHLQRAAIPIEQPEDEQRPFVLAMGSAHRDYATLFEAARRWKHPTLVVAARHAVEGLTLPDNVELRNGLSELECRHLAQRARVNVVPVANAQTASGQVTLLEAMRMGRAVVATRCIGSEDYLADDVTGLLVEPRSAAALHGAVTRLWDDAALRRRLGLQAARFAAEHCSDEAAGAALRTLLDEVEAETGTGAGGADVGASGRRG